MSSAAFPEEVRAPVHYSAAFGAVGVYLVTQQLLPYERACEVMEDLLGPPMRVGTLQSMIRRCAEQVAPIEEQIKAALRRVAGKRWWTHVSATATLTHDAVHPQRGRAALDAIGILPHFGGISIHDGFRSYFRYGCQHALCNAHHLLWPKSSSSPGPRR